MAAEYSSKIRQAALHIERRYLRYMCDRTERDLLGNRSQEERRNITAKTDRVYAGNVEEGREVLYLHVTRRDARNRRHSIKVPCYHSGLTFSTYALYTCQDLLEEKVKRGWIERLFTRPWRPLQKDATKFQHGVVLKWLSGQYILVAHPLTSARLLREAYEEE